MEKRFENNKRTCSLIRVLILQHGHVYTVNGSVYLNCNLYRVRIFVHWAYIFIPGGLHFFSLSYDKTLFNCLLKYIRTRVFLDNKTNYSFISNKQGGTLINFPYPPVIHFEEFVPPPPLLITCICNLLCFSRCVINHS